MFSTVQFSRICKASDGVGDEPSDSIMSNFFKLNIMDLSGNCKTEEFRSWERYLK
jgi:hypothetical protein